jgi:hypothetical protein
MIFLKTFTHIIDGILKKISWIQGQQIYFGTFIPSQVVSGHKGGGGIEQASLPGL